MSDIKMISLPIDEYQKLDRAVDAADALAKAAKDLRTNEQWAELQNALAAYEKVRGIK